MKNIFVGNLSFEATEADLTALFQPFGPVGRVHIATDRETGRARGFAFVEMPNDAEGVKAIAALDGQEMGGRILKVNEAQPKGERPAHSNRGGGHRGGGRGRGGFSHEDYREPRKPRR